MTKIECNKTDNEFELIATGHAGYTEYGKDIVCSAISMLVQTLYLYARDEITEACLEEGEVFLRGQGEKAMMGYDFALTGLRALASEYPLYVSVSEGCPFFNNKNIE